MPILRKASLIYQNSYNSPNIPTLQNYLRGLLLGVTSLSFTMKVKFVGAAGWLSQLSIRLLISAQVTIPGLWHRAPDWTLGWAQSLPKIPSLPVPLPPLSLLHIPGKSGLEGSLTRSLPGWQQRRLMGAACDSKENGAGSRNGHLVTLADGRVKLQLNLNWPEGT